MYHYNDLSLRLTGSLSIKVLLSLASNTFPDLSNVVESAVSDPWIWRRDYCSSKLPIENTKGLHYSILNCTYAEHYFL